MTCAGGVRLFTNVYVLVRVLRDTLKCKLPIQLWHFGGAEISPSMRHIMQSLDVELVDVEPLLAEEEFNLDNGWQLKPYAIYKSRFSDVIYLDADQVPIRNPEFLFDTPEYHKTGAIFWPDIIDVIAENPIWELLQLEGQQLPSWESGQAVIDKQRHGVALLTCLYLNLQYEVVYSMIYGDKDTFLFAWKHSGCDASVVPHRPYSDNRVMVQRDFEGAPLFQHRTNAKWSYDAPQFDFEGSKHTSDCLEFLEDLKAVWNGSMFFAPDRSLQARQEEQRLVALGPLQIEIVGNYEIAIRLLPNNEIGLGRSAERRNWFVEEVSGCFNLILRHGERDTMRLVKSSDGFWEGKFLTMDGGTALLNEPEKQGGGEMAPSVADGLVRSVAQASGVGASAGSQTLKLAENLKLTLILMLRAEPGLRLAIHDLLNGPEALANIAENVLQSVPEDVDRKPLKDGSAMQKGYVNPDILGL